MIKLKYDSIGCRTTTDCPFLEPKQGVSGEYKTRVASAICQECDHFVCINEKKKFVKCDYMGVMNEN